MLKQIIQYTYKLLGTLFIIVLASCNQPKSKQYKILIIQSFESEYAGYKEIENDIRCEFKKQNKEIETRSFYLECDSYLDKEERERIYNYLETNRSWHPDMIMIYDDQATFSLIACEHPLINEIPIVFAGVNFPNWELLKQHPNITGVWDKPNFLKITQMVENLFGPMKINIWMDNTFLGKQTTNLFLEETKSPNDGNLYNMQFIQNSDGTFNITKDSLFFKPLTQKPSNTFFTLINSRESSSGNLLWILAGLTRHSVFIQSKRDFSSKRLGLYSDAPTFTVVNEGFGLKEGILGGYITSYKTQIKESVNIAVQILQGTKVKDISITQSHKEYLIDWTEVERWNISKESIPKNYHIIKMPFYIRYKLYLISFGSFLGLTIIFLICYLTYLYLRENKNKRLAQEKQRKGERFLSLALEGGKVFAFQLSNRLFSFDKDFYPFVGIVERPFTIEEFETHLYPEDIDILLQNITDARSGNTLTNISQIRCSFDNKAYQWWEFRYTYNIEDDIFNGLCLNIQKEKEAEKELIEARHKAEESDKMKSAFLANMSHEIRTPLNAIVGFSNIITEDEVDLSVSEKKEIQGLISTNSDLLLKLINDILDLSRIESGKMEFTFASCNLTELMNNTFYTHQLLMPKGVELKLETPTEAITIDTDHHRLTQVITNFINNASKFTKSGYIKIGYNYTPGNSTVDIFVEDTGIGIPKEKQHDVFERFNKLNEFAQGTGLGLAICQIIIQRFGGKINLQSEEGKGSRFTITLPLHILH